MKNIPHAFLLAAVLFLSGCGYTTRSALPNDLRSIHIEQFDNRIDYTDASKRSVYFPLIEVDARNAIIDRFQFDGNLDIADPANADLILKGKLIQYYRRGLRFDDDDTAEEYRIHVVVSLELWNQNTGELRWREPRFVGEDTFFLTGPEATTEESAVQRALEDLARRIVERTVEDW